MSPARQLADGIGELGLSVSAQTQAQLLAFLDLILKWNRVHNLTAIRDLPAMVSTHLLDSLSVAPHLSPQTMLDVGSGGGFPGIPLALIWPESRVTLLDSSQKKAAFLQQAKIELALPNLSIVCARAESWLPDQRFDVVISRAFAELPEFVRVAARFCNAGGTLAAMKGAQPDAEIARLPAGCRVRSVIPLRVPGLQADRHLVLIDP
jgi:16S rRNA (guanine527-N7)-methyltransferase